MSKDNGQRNPIIREENFLPGGSLAIENGNGDVQVQGWNQNKIYVQATKIKSHNIHNIVNLGGVVWVNGQLVSPRLFSFRNNDEAAMRNTRVEMSIDSHKAVLKTTYVPSELLRAQVDYVVKVPHETEVQVQTDNGRIEALQLFKKLKARTSNGTIKLNDCNNVSAKSSNGRIKAANCNDLNAKTSNGSIEIDQCVRVQQAHASNSSINIKESKDIKNVATSNGSIKIEDSGNIDTATLQTSNGKIMVNGKRIRN